MISRMFFAARANHFKCVSKQWNRTLIRSASNANLGQQFEEVLEKVKLLKNEPNDDVKLQLYGLFKQSKKGPCDLSKPDQFDYIAVARWEAWSSLGSITKEEAQQKYIDLAKQLIAADNGKEENSSVSPNLPSEDIKLKSANGITTITLNRPQKKNALTVEMYSTISKILNEEAKNDETSVVVLRAEGEYFCSGNDLNNFMSLAPKGDFKAMAQNGVDLFKQFVISCIDFPKLLVAAVNGPATGIAVTVLGLCDVVYAAENTKLSTPFTSLGQTPEACSSYTFPRIMGNAKASKLLLLSQEITAEEAKNANLITDIFPTSTFNDEVDARLREMAVLPKLSLQYGKKLMRGPHLEQLHKTNLEECHRMIERLQSEDFQKAITAFFTKKSSS